MSPIAAQLFVMLQHVLPKYLLTSMVYRLSRVRNVRVKNTLINRFIEMFDVETSEIARPVPDGFATFNDFFTRELNEDARTVDPQESSVVSPVDGTVSAAGAIHQRKIFQAKGKHYSLHDLLATNLQEADQFVDGSFATIYLAPYNYHRVHAPIAGELLGIRYVPGDLFSVNTATVSFLPQLFCRNERLICQFSTEVGPVAVVFVGALNVGSISTPWTGEIRPAKRGVGGELRLSGSADTRLRKGDLLGWFNMGSTVITLFPPAAVTLNDDLTTGRQCRMGMPIGSFGARP